MQKNLNPIESLRESIRYIEERLAAPALDGTPYIVTMLDERGQVLVYGEWMAGRGFKHEDTIPDHLCGTIQKSEKSAKEAVAILTGAGKKATYMHWKVLLECRLIKQRSLLTSLTIGEAVAA